MTRSKLDHLVVAAADLDRGTAYIEELLGVRTAPGGRHEAIGTHNRLLRLGDDQYLEIIAVDPDGSSDRPRWFALDDPDMQASLRESPRLVTWVARTNSIESAAALPAYKSVDVADMVRGDLRWRITIPRDGGLLYDGAVPLLIEWRTESTPPGRLPDADCALKRLAVQSPHAKLVQQTLQDLNLDNVDIDQSVQTGFAAIIKTPGRGEAVLSSVVDSHG